jgi:hypothetical protein
VSGTRRNGLLDEQGDSREILEDLHLDVASGLGRAAEHGGGAADDDGTWAVLGGHVLDKVFEGFEDAGVLVSGNDERVVEELRWRGRWRGR